MIAFPSRVTSRPAWQAHCNLFPDDLFPEDFDRFNMGIAGLCAPTNAFPLRDQVLVQGGTISLSSWVFRFGARYVF